MGADRAILIVTGRRCEPRRGAARRGEAAESGSIEAEGPGLVIAGKQAIDNDMNATGQMLAALIGLVRRRHLRRNWSLDGRESDGHPRGGRRVADAQR